MATSKPTGKGKSKNCGAGSAGPAAGVDLEPIWGEECDYLTLSLLSRGRAVAGRGAVPWLDALAKDDDTRGCIVRVCLFSRSEFEREPMPTAADLAKRIADGDAPLNRAERGKVECMARLHASAVFLDSTPLLIDRARGLELHAKCAAAIQYAADFMRNVAGTFAGVPGARRLAVGFRNLLDGDNPPAELRALFDEARGLLLADVSSPVPSAPPAAGPEPGRRRRGGRRIPWRDEDKRRIRDIVFKEYGLCKDRRGRWRFPGRIDYGKMQAAFESVTDTQDAAYDPHAADFEGVFGFTPDADTWRNAVEAERRVQGRLPKG